MINGALKHLSVWVSVFQSNYEKNGLGWNGNISRANYCLILTRADLRPNKNDAIFMKYNFTLKKLQPQICMVQV